MATINKDFKIKNGLIVEGTTAKVNGHNILLESTSDQYILNLVGGVAYITSVAGDLSVTDGQLSINETGLADSLTVDSNFLYDDGQGNIMVDSEGIYDDLIAGGVATTTDISTALNDYTTTSNLDTTIDGYGYLKSADLSGYATESYVGSQGFLVSSDLNGYVTETGAQTLSNKTFSDSVTLSGSGDFAINGNNNIVLTPGSGQSVKWGSDILATQTYADTAVSDHNTLTTGVHGVNGDVVGTSDTQVLTNKTINDELGFTNPSTYAVDGGIKINDANENFEIRAYTADIEIIANGGDITLNPNGTAYYGGTTAADEIATHGYVDNAVAGLNWKQAVNLLYDAAIPVLSGSGATQLVVDGHTVLGDEDSGYRLLLTGTTNPGIYVYNSVDSAWELTRSTDADAYTELVGAAVYVMEGTQYGSTSWVQSNHYLTDFSGQNWTQFSGQGSVTAGNGIEVSGLTVSIDTDVVATQTDLSDGLGTKQDTLTAGTGITLSGSTISVTTNTYDAYGSASSALSDANDYTDTAVSTKANSADPTITGSLTLDGTGDFTINADAGIILQAGTSAYLTSATAGNEIATEGYVDSAIAGVTVDYAAMAGTYIDWSGNQFNVNASDLITGASIATESFVTTALGDYTTTANLDTTVSGLGYAKTVDVPTQYTDQDALNAIDGANITPLTVKIGNYRKEEGTQQYVSNASTVTVHSFSYPYESVKYLVRVVGWDNGVKHSQITEILMTVDGNNNIAITEYGNVYTSTNPLATFSAEYSGTYDLTATTAVAGCEIITAATMLSWVD